MSSDTLRTPVIAGAMESQHLLKQRIEYSGSNPLYIGLAIPGTATSAASWQIRKMTYSGSNLTQVDFADSSSDFVKSWDDRATYTYA